VVQLGQAGLHLRVAVGAEQHALSRLLAGALKGSRDTRIRDAEVLGGWIDVVKLERDDRA
jgi:hypothetical protein